MGRCATCNDEINAPTYRTGDEWFCCLKCAKNHDVNHMALQYNAEQQHQESMKHAPESPAEDDE